MFECSAKKGININEAFISLSENIIKNKKNIEQWIELDKYEKNKTKSTCC